MPVFWRVPNNGARMQAYRRESLYAMFACPAKGLRGGSTS